MNLALELRPSEKFVNRRVSMKDLFKPIEKAAHHSWTAKYQTRCSFENVLSMSRELVFDRTFEKYLKEIEDITRRPLHPCQREQVKYHIDNYSYSRLSSSESQSHRRDFNSKKKDIIADWEKMTGNTWPTYDEAIYNKSGKIIRQPGNRYDMHHIIENCYGGDNEAWNMHPAKHPSEHQDGIHAKGRLCSQIFNIH